MIRAACYQFEPAFGETERNLETVLQALADLEADLIVLPELFTSGYQFASAGEVERMAERVPGGRTTEALGALSRKKGAYIVAGLCERDNERFYNSAIVTGPHGFMGVYRKTHLFFEEKLWFSPGDTGFKVFSTEIGRVGVMICFDWIFPESMRTLALMGADVVAHPANLVLPYCPTAMPVRCLENKLYAMTANRVGREQRKEGPALTFIGTSQIVAPDSTVLARAPETGEALICATIDVEKARDKALNPHNDLFQDLRPEMYLHSRSRKEK